MRLVATPTFAMNLWLILIHISGFTYLASAVPPHGHVHSPSGNCSSHNCSEKPCSSPSRSGSGEVEGDHLQRTDGDRCANFTEGESRITEHLTKRALHAVQTRAELNGYYLHVPDDPGFIDLIPDTPSERPSAWQPSYCLQYKLVEFPRDHTTYIGVGGPDRLRGCMVMTVLSRRGIYMCHFWESLHFHMEGEQTSNYLGLESVLDLIRTGQSDHPDSVQGVALERTLFNQPDDNTKIYFLAADHRLQNMEPLWEESPDLPPFRHYLSIYQLEAAVRDVLGFHAPCEWMGYTARLKEWLPDQTAGSCMFEYNPKGWQDMPGGRPVQRWFPLMRLLYEENLMANMALTNAPIYG